MSHCRHRKSLVLAVLSTTLLTFCADVQPEVSGPAVVSTEVTQEKVTANFASCLASWQATSPDPIQVYTNDRSTEIPLQRCDGDYEMCFASDIEAAEDCNWALLASENPSAYVTLTGTNSEYTLAAFVRQPSTGTAITPIPEITAIVTVMTTNPTVELGNLREFSGTLRLDGTSEGATRYEWVVVTGPSGGDMAFDNATAPIVVATATVPGEYLIRLKAWDLAGNVGEDLVQAVLSTPEAVTATAPDPTPTPTPTPDPALSISLPPQLFASARTAQSTTIAGTCRIADGDITLTASGSVGAQTVNCTNSAFNVTVDLTGEADGDITLEFSNDEETASTTISKDTAYPVLSVGAIVTVTNNNQDNYPITGGCSEADYPVIITYSAGIVSSDCVGSSYTAALDLSALPEGQSTLGIATTDRAGNTSQLPITITKDTTAPSLTVTARSTATAATAANYEVYGTCGASGEEVRVTSPIAATGNCLSGQFSFFLDLSALSDGSLDLILAHDSASGSTTTSSQSITLDTAAPTVTVASSESSLDDSNWSSVVVSGDCDAAAGNVTLLSDGRADTLACTGTYSTTLDLSTLSGNKVVELRARQEDAAGNRAVAALDLERELCSTAEKAATAFTDLASLGTGTAADPYIVCNETLLQLIDTLNNTDSTATYALGTDITMTGNLTPIGSATVPFEGNFYGNGYTITDLTVSITVANAGLFAVTQWATIQDINFANPSITTTSDDAMGVLVGHAIATRVKNITITGATVTGGDDRIAGLIGDSDGLIVDGCDVTSAVDGDDAIAGIIGEADTVMIKDCQSSGTVTGIGDKSGGIMGNVYNASIFLNNSSDTILSFSEEQSHGGIGGHVAASDSFILFRRNSFTGTLNAYETGGGLIGRLSIDRAIDAENYQGSILSDNFVNATVSAVTTKAGGAFGELLVDTTASMTVVSYARRNYTAGTMTTSGAPDLIAGGLLGDGSGAAAVNLLSDSFSVIALDRSPTNTGGLIGLPNSGNALYQNLYWVNGMNLPTGSTTYASADVSSMTRASALSDFYSRTYPVYANWDFADVAQDGSHDTWRFVAANTLPVLSQRSDVTIETTFSGEGTELEPYLISSVAEWNSIGDTEWLMEANFLLTADLDFATAGLTPIGSFERPFTGVFDGGNQTISNIAILRDNDYPNGVFPAITGGTVRQLQMDTITVDAGNGTSGGLSGLTAYSIIDGITVSNITISSTVTQSKIIGGLIGEGHHNAITNVTVTGLTLSTSGLAEAIGGAIGICHHACELTNIAVTGTISGALATDTGGIAGRLARLGIIDKAASNVTITSTLESAENIGGLVGQVEHSSNLSLDEILIQRSYYNGTITVIDGSGNIGGLVGQLECNSSEVTVQDVYMTGVITGPGNDVGGFFGDGDANCVNIDNAYVAATIEGGVDVGGIWGNIRPVRVTDTFAITTVNDIDGGADVGGTGDGAASTSTTGLFWVDDPGDDATSCYRDSGTACDTTYTAESDFHSVTNNVYTRAGNTWDFTTIWESDGSSLPTLR